jgi:hypothetical protein
MNLHKWLAAVVVIWALDGCARGATGQGQAPSLPIRTNAHRSGAGAIILLLDQCIEKPEQLLATSIDSREQL